MKTKQPSRQTRLPLVSIIMPVYNAGDFLVEAIESILDQTYKNFEFIIVDDASTDTSASIIATYKKQYPKKIKAIRMQKNLNGGGDMCANEGIKIAKGQYIARMDADDVADPTRLEKQISFLQKNPTVFLVGSSAHIIDEKGFVIGEKKEPTQSADIYNAYFVVHPLIHPSCMYKRTVNGKPFAYDIRYSANNDYYTFFKLICSGVKFANLSEKLLYYRIHGKNDTLVHMKNKFMNTLRIRMTMLIRYGYRPTPKGIVTLFLQIIVALMLPETVMKSIYLFSKGLVHLSNPFRLTVYSLK